MDKNGRSKARPVLICEGTGRTKQSFKNKADINKTVARYKRTGVLASGLGICTKKPMYADFTGITDYKSMIQRDRDMKAWFMSLPSATRKKYDNDPGKILEFISNPENKEQAMKDNIIPRPVNAKYTDENKNDITEEVIGKRGLFKKGILVTKEGVEILDKDGKQILRTNLDDGTQEKPKEV